jgi:hypothetical protein
MTPQEAVDRIEKILQSKTSFAHQSEAWQTLKTAVSEQTAHNTASAPFCPQCQGLGFVTSGMGERIECDKCNE